MQSRETPTAPTQSYRKKIFDECFGIIGLASSIPNVIYAMTFVYSNEIADIDPTQVSWEWYENLPPAVQFAVAYNIISTLAVSGAFGYRFLKEARRVIVEEWDLFRQKKISWRFYGESLLGLLAGISGGGIGGEVFASPAAQWPARFVCLMTVGGLSFLGMNEFIMAMTDEHYKLKNKVLGALEHLSDEFQSQINNMADDGELDSTQVYPYIENVLRIAYERELQRRQAYPYALETVFREETTTEYYRKLFFKAGDAIVPGFLALCSFLVFANGGFGGLNVIAKVFSDDGMDHSPLALKIFLGSLTGLPLMLFMGFKAKVFNNSLVESYPEMKRDCMTAVKLAALLSLCPGNATWYYTLERLAVEGENIFPFILNTTFGKTAFPWLVYAGCEILATDGLTPLLFPPQIEPGCTVAHVIKRVRYQIKPQELEGLQMLSLFKPPKTIHQHKHKDAKQPPPLTI